MSSHKHVICIGAFDGVHRGHQLLISRGREFADSLQLPLIAVTFDPHPRTILRSEGAPPALCTLDRRIQYLLEAGADEVDVIEFDANFASLSAHEFIDDVIVEGLHASVVVVGEDFRFGHKGSGSVATLADASAARGFATEAVSLFLEDDEKVSSSRIREEVLAGDVLDAARLLGRPYSVEGTVVHGDHRGRELGYPTANLAWIGSPAIPADGVYATFLVVDGEYLPAATSIGLNPQFEGRERRVETYVLDRDDLDLYGGQIVVEFVEFLRPQQVFDQMDSFVAQMGQDVARARALTSGLG
jgi:riboflavin kinase/FMN adenylyltransferase